ncbi:MAG TPA: cell envelope biogenesis protein TolA [Bradyrhizobium sp.]|nr:cell envelope biogenesis protein TolA [Bradyrhizobium sp.]
MQYLVATYWMWFVVALLMGGAVGYWLPGRQVVESGIGPLLRWGAAAFLVGLAVVVLHVYPLRDEPDLETVLLPAFCFAIGGLLGRWLRAASSQAELARATLAGNAQVESAVLGARAKAAVRSAKAVEDARLDAEARAAGEARLAEATKVAAAKAAAVKAAAAMAAVAKAAEEVRLAAEARTAEQARLAAVAKAAEQARLAAETKAAEEARLVAAVNAVQQERLATEAKAAEEARVVALAKAAVTETAEQVRPAAETRAAEEARLAAAVNAVQQERLATEAKAAEQVRLAAAAEGKAAQGPDVAATTAQATALHPGSRPPGIAAPAEGEADDLKRIKGMGPDIEKACNALGIYQFRQIANWTPEEAIWVGHHIGFPGRIAREHWIVQARLLASGGETEHSRAVKSGFVDRKADEPLDPAAAEMLGKSLPEQAAVVDGEDKHPGRRPYGLATPLGKADNLKRIRGVGPQNESRLHGLGIWHVSQIAAWTDENVKWVGSYLGSSGRTQRDNWVAQARDLAAGKGTESSRRVAAGKVPPPKDDGSLGQDNVQTLK